MRRALSKLANRACINAAWAHARQQPWRARFWTWLTRRLERFEDD